MYFLIVETREKIMKSYALAISTPEEAKEYRPHISINKVKEILESYNITTVIVHAVSQVDDEIELKLKEFTVSIRVLSTTATFFTDCTAPVPCACPAFVVDSI
jgi:RNase H-fold protein (predicted Holliday junction resolvase)